ncbi:amidohydrolase family protein [archaeon]|nr:amidohydrolase family protein [archaeon]MBT3451045.1 amidohydrolase family protein [archaeon]MBT6869135.1 amidohydrolase family protein [archaeon]MBT7192782.1 amidohydrolase family protein [archaeon]MBT7381322.1 amidohydrolase family protein [archaeon]
MLKFDAHTHPIGNQIIKESILSTEQKESIENYKKRNNMPLGDPKDIATLIESSHLDRAIVLASDKPYDGSKVHIEIPNELVLKLCSNHPELLVAVSINPTKPNAAEYLDTLMEKDIERKIAACKWVPNSLMFDPSNKEHINFYRRLAFWNLPVITHTGNQHFCYNPNQSYGDPELLKTPLEEGVRIIGAHCGADTGNERYFDNFVQMLKQYENLYTDTSAMIGTTRKPEQLIYLFSRKDLHHKLIHGSDFPVRPKLKALKNILPEEIIYDLSLIEENPIQQDYLCKIAVGAPESCFSNFERLYNQIKRN